MSALSEILDKDEDSRSGEQDENKAESGEELEEDEEDEECEPPYSIKELVEIIIDFYRFLASLHYDPSDLKIPPPEGRPTESLPTIFMKQKSPRVIQLMSHLPYFQNSKDSTHVHYKSKLLDYTDANQHDLARARDKLFFDINDNLESSDGDPVDPSDVLVIAWGYESGGHYFALDALHGEMTVDVVRMNLLSPEDVRDFFDDLKEEYRNLELMPCPNRETISARGLDERDEPIERAEVLAQTEEWGTDLDWQFVRQIYRQYGWPDAFQREEAVRAVEEVMALKSEERGEWEGAFH